MRSYDYPPSQQIRRYEPFEPNSHFHVRGKCHFEGKKYPCDFEVAYTLDGEIWVVCYLDSQAQLELFGIPDRGEMPWKMYTPKQERIQVDFSGIDLRSRLLVRVNQAISISNGMGFSDRAPEFVANSFELIQQDEDVPYNNPPPSTHSIDFELLNVASFPKYASSDLIPFYGFSYHQPPFNRPIFASSEPIPFNVGGKHLVYLKPALLADNQSVSTENSILRIPLESIPIGWSAEDIADIWCSAISIATGRDIRWIVKRTHTKRVIKQKFKRRSNIIRNRSTYGLITNQYIFWLDDAIFKFIASIFDSIRRKKVTPSALRDYSRIMWHFVEYRLITNRTEDQARLITTTVEELLTRWEDHTRTTPKAVVSETEAEQLWSDLQEKWLPTLNKISETLTTQRQHALKSRLETSFLVEIVRPGFRKRLKNMLELGQNDQAWIKKHAKSRIEAFVETRNKIAHTGRFPTEDTDELFDYYFNMLMVLPLLIFTIFGYQGTYIDLSQQYREFHARKKARESE